MPVDTRAIKRLVRENLNELNTIEDVARRMNLSPESVRKEFWRRERVSLKDFIIDCKIEEAKRLLIETDLLCKEICLEVGFEREDSGTEMFKRRTGMSMKEFRNYHRQRK